jgi:uncharacterized protein (TIGR02301 family)
MIRAVALALGLSIATTAPALAESAPPAPDHHDLLRLSELLGALHYLRPLCGATDGAVWRSKMADLIAAESDAGLREQLAGAFNRGYETFRASYRECTPRARLLTGRYLDEGARLAGEMAQSSVHAK